MKVLWFEVTEPSRFQDNGLVIGGWQDSLETIVRDCPDIELSIAFESNDVCCPKKNVDGVTYIPICIEKNIVNKIKENLSWSLRIQNLKQAMKKIVDEVNPDLIQVFGTEWPYGLVADITDKPVVIHIMGALVQYSNALYAPGFSSKDLVRSIPFWNVWKRQKIARNQKLFSHQIDCEKEVWRKVKYYMGRTEWDKNLSKIMHPNSIYFHVEEALRPEIMADGLVWKKPISSKIQLVSTGCSSFWKGPDMMLRTAQILKDRQVDFEWLVAGKMPSDIKHCVENKLGTTFEENNIKLIGFTKPSDLRKILCRSTLYVHTAYVENSPNSICEAQILGVPVVSTNVGGVSTLLGDDGIMVPANDPWQMACAIIELTLDKDKMENFSKNGRNKALARHNTENIKSQLLLCYNEILQNGRKAMDCAC